MKKNKQQKQYCVNHVLLASEEYCAPINHYQKMRTLTQNVKCTDNLVLVWSNK